MKKSLLFSSIVLLSAVLSLNVQAKEIPEHEITKLSIREKASVEAMPDTFKTTIEFTDIDRDSQTAQNEVNKQINNAVSIIKAERIKYNLGSFSTYRQYDSKKYVARQSISLESKNSKDIEKVTSLLQKAEGKVTGTYSFVSDAAQQKYFETLFDQAYKKADKKAKFITKKVGGKKFNITKIDYYLNERGPALYRAELMSAKSAGISANEKVNVDNNEKKITLDLNINIAITK